MMQQETKRSIELTKSNFCIFFVKALSNSAMTMDGWKLDGSALRSS